MIDYILTNRISDYISIADIKRDLLIDHNEEHIGRCDEFVCEYHQPYEERNNWYHIGRINHFIKHGIDDPIVLDCVCSGGRIYPEPIIIDGNHRYMAALICNDKTIPVKYSGRIDLLNYLTGKSHEKPGY